MANTGVPGVLGGHSRSADKFVVRLQESMRDRIKAVADTQHRSMNSYIIRALMVALEIDEKEAGTYVEPEVGVVMETRPQWAVGMVCRRDGVPKVIRELQVNDFGEGDDFIEALIDFGGSPGFVPIDDLEAY